MAANQYENNWGNGLTQNEINDEMYGSNTGYNTNIDNNNNNNGNSAYQRQVFRGEDRNWIKSFGLDNKVIRQIDREVVYVNYFIKNNNPYAIQEYLKYIQTILHPGSITYLMLQEAMFSRNITIEPLMERIRKHPNEWKPYGPELMYSAVFTRYETDNRTTTERISFLEFIHNTLNIGLDQPVGKHPPRSLLNVASNLTIVEWLLNHGANPDITETNLIDIIPKLITGYQESRTRYLQKAIMLIDAGIDVDLQSPSDMNTALHEALLYIIKFRRITHELNHIIKLLLEKGARTDLENDEGTTVDDILKRYPKLLRNSNNRDYNGNNFYRLHNSDLNSNDEQNGGRRVIRKKHTTHRRKATKKRSRRTHKK